jgi:hypothetical protein
MSGDSRHGDPAGRPFDGVTLRRPAPPLPRGAVAVIAGGGAITFPRQIGRPRRRGIWRRLREWLP